MKIISIEDAPEIFSAPGSSGKQLLVTRSNEIVYLEIQPGNKIEKHSLPLKVIFFVTNGEGEVHIGKDKIKVTVGTCVECEANEERAWVNTGSEILKILVIKEVSC